MYLGHADIFEGDELADRMVVMRRLREEDRLTGRLLDYDTTTERKARADDGLRQVARAVAAFHSKLPALVGDDAKPASVDSVRKNWHDNFAVIEEHLGSVLDPDEHTQIQHLVARYLDAHADIFARRIDDGFVRDGHGDLRAEDIFCTEDGPRILDCLSFDYNLRAGDVLLDMAFLGMDTDRLAGSEASQRLMRYYREFSNESHPSSLAHFYVAYRAHVRAKIACIRHEQGVQSAASDARSYHALTLHHLRRSEVRIVLVGGGAGMGKTTVANGLSKEMGWMVLNADELRKDLAGVERDDHGDAAPGAGLYSDENKDRVYTELIREACAIVRSGETVVLDASWTNARHRQEARDAAAECGVQITEIECELDPGIAKERIARRMAGYSASDATPEVADFLAATRDPWPEAHRLQTGAPVTQVVRRGVVLACAVQALG